MKLKSMVALPICWKPCPFVCWKVIGWFCGVVCDAEADPTHRWDSIRCRLDNASYVNVPTSPAADGLVIPPPENTLFPRFGIWIMPDNRSPGILENFLEFLVPAEDQLFSYTEQCVNHIPAGVRLFGEADRPKAKLHTWLAWQAEPGKPLGQSITKRVLRAESPSCQTVVNWIRRLYLA